MKVILAAVLMGGLLTACTNQEQNKKEENMTTLNLTQEWDKVFPLSEKVNHCKVTFETQYGLTLAAAHHPRCLALRPLRRRLYGACGQGRAEESDSLGQVG
jgi:hypothetical protein